MSIKRSILIFGGFLIICLVSLILIGYFSITKNAEFIQPGAQKFKNLDLIPQESQTNQILINVTQSGFTPDKVEINAGQIINFQNLTGVTIILEPGYLRKSLTLEPKSVLSAKFDQTIELNIKDTNKKIEIIIK